MRLILASLALVLAAGACGNQRPSVECRDSTDCSRFAGGVCHTAPLDNQWCAYPCNCSTGLCYSDLNVGDGLAGMCVEGGPDGGVDGNVGVDSAVAVDATTPTDARAPDAGTCTPTEETCIDAMTLQTCDSFGYHAQLCAEGCAAGKCNNCTPNAYACQDSETTQHCTADGTGLTFFNCQAVFGVNCNPQTGYCYGHTPP